MADKKKDKVPEHIEKFYKHWEKAKKLIDTTDHHHRSAYNSAVDKHLKNEEGQIDYDKLKDSKVQLAFADHMSDYYFDRAAEYFGFKKENEELTKKIKGDIFKKDMLMKAYANVTQADLRGLVQKNKNRFKYEAFDQVRDKFMDDIKTRLHTAASSHLTKDHIEDIVKYTKAGDYVNSENMETNHAASLLAHYKEHGSVPTKPELLEQLVGEYAVKKDKKKKAA